MSRNGYTPVQVDVISEEGIASICPQEWKAFTDQLGKHQIHLDDFAKAKCENNGCEVDLNVELMRYEGEDGYLSESDIAEFWAAWDALRSKFETNTLVSILPNEYLTLELGYHDRDEMGCQLDEVDGAFFYVERAWKETAAHLRFKQYITRCGYVIGYD